ncbi:MAG: geranylgeranylglyceryl/heptaprenylglyceryl phosphate synthase [Thermoplasmata archaeon]
MMTSNIKFDGKVYRYIEKKLKIEKLHMTLIDPDKQSAKIAGRIGTQAENAGSDAIMVGGSTGVSNEKLDDTVLALKDSCDIPVILFPTSSNVISMHADAIYYMSMLNSRSLKYVIGEQVRAAQYIKKIGLEAIPMGYVIIEPGMKVGEVGHAKVVKRDDIKQACDYACAAELLGMKLVYLEAGSGAPKPVPPEMVRAVKAQLSIPLIVGGGIRTAGDASKTSRAGADIIVTGTIVEEVRDIEVTLKEIIKAIKSHAYKSC